MYFDLEFNQKVNEGKDVYVYFNNTAGDAVKNLVTLNSYVHAACEAAP